MATLLDKIGARRDTAQKLAKQHEAALESAKTEFHRLEGAKGVLSTNVQEAIGSVRSYWKKDWDEQKISKEEAEAAFKAIEQVAGAMRSLAKKAEVDQLVKQGVMEAMEKAIGACEKLFEEEGKKAQTFAQALENGEIEIDKETGEPVHVKPAERDEDGRPPLHVVGVRPEPGIAARRKAETAEQEAKANADQAEPAQVEDDPKSGAKKPKGKKRLTGSKGT